MNSWLRQSPPPIWLIRPEAPRWGSQSLSVTTGVEFDDMESLKRIPITVGNGNTIYLEDVANVYSTLKDAAGIGRYNGQDTVALGIKKQQKSSAMDVSKAVNKNNFTIN